MDAHQGWEAAAKHEEEIGRNQACPGKRAPAALPFSPASFMNICTHAQTQPSAPATRHKQPGERVRRSPWRVWKISEWARVDQSECHFFTFGRKTAPRTKTAPTPTNGSKKTGFGDKPGRWVQYGKGHGAAAAGCIGGPRAAVRGHGGSRHERHERNQRDQPRDAGSEHSCLPTAACLRNKYPPSRPPQTSPCQIF